MSLLPNQFRIPKEYDDDPNPMSLTVFMDDLDAYEEEYAILKKKSNELCMSALEAIQILIRGASEEVKTTWEQEYDESYEFACYIPKSQSSFAKELIYKLKVAGYQTKRPQAIRAGKRERRKDLKAEMEELRKEIREKDIALMELTKEHAQLEADYQDLMLKIEEHVCPG